MSFSKSLQCFICSSYVSLQESLFPEDLYDLIMQHKIKELHWICKSCEAKNRKHSCCCTEVLSKMNDMFETILELKDAYEKSLYENKRFNSFLSPPDSSHEESQVFCKAEPDEAYLCTKNNSVVAVINDSLDKSLLQISSASKKNKAALEILQTISKDKLKINNSEVRSNKAIVDSFMDCLIEFLKQDEEFRNIYHKPGYTGSTYNDTRIVSATEYDINVVLRLPQSIALKPEFFGEPCAFVKLKWKIMPYQGSKDAISLKFIKDIKYGITEGYLKPSNLLSWLQHHVDKFLTSKPKLPSEIHVVKARQSGPARTIEIETHTGCVINIDLVPVFMFDYASVNNEGLKQKLYQYSSKSENGYYVVPKECKGEAKLNQNDCHLSWRMDFSLAEKEMFHDKQCGKSVVRLLKLLRDKKGWKGLASYYIKTIILWMVHENPNKEYWSSSVLLDRLLEAMKLLKKHLDLQNLPFFFCPEHNLFYAFNSDQCKNWSNNLQHDITSIQSDYTSLNRIF